MNYTKNKLAKLVVFFIILFAGFLRLNGLEERDLIEWDEAYYFGVVKTIRAAFDWYFDKIIGKENPKTLSEQLLEQGVAVNQGGKYGFIFILFLGSFLFGVNANLILIISALAGTGTIYLTYKIGKILFNETIGIIAMLLLTVSFYHTYYSRSGFSTSVSVFFVYLGLFLYLNSLNSEIRKSKKQIFASGLAIGYAFTVHYNLLIIPLIFFGFIFLELWQIKDKKFWFKRLILFSSGSVIFLWFFEFGSRLIKWYVYSSNVLRGALRGGEFFSYIEELIFLGGQRGGLTNPSFFYFKIIKEWEGILVLLLLIVSIIWSVFYTKKNFSIKNLSCTSLAILPLLFWTFNYTTGRNIAVIFPSSAILISSLGYFLYSRIKQSIEKNEFDKLKFHKFNSLLKVASILILIIICIGGVINLQPVLKMKSGMRDAINFMNQSGSVKHISSEFFISRLYAGRDKVIDTTFAFSNKAPKEKLASLYNEGYRFILMGGVKFLSPPEFVKLFNNVSPVFKTPHTIYITIPDSYVHVDKKVQNELASSPEEIQIFAIKDILDKNNR